MRREARLRIAPGSIWVSASLRGGVGREAALDRANALIDALAAKKSSEGATVAFNTAYALFEKDPKAAQPFLERIISTWPKSDLYWQARYYVSYGQGRMGNRAEARRLLEEIVKEGPAADQWVRSAKRMLADLDRRARRGK